LYFEGTIDFIISAKVELKRLKLALASSASDVIKVLVDQKDLK